MSKLTNEDIKEVASKYQLEPAVIKAVILAESRGYGFYRTGQYKGELLCRFEGHWFRRYTKGIYDKSHPTLSFSNWRLGFKYNQGLNEFGRFFEAFKLNREAAWKSTSWGMFQIMGSWGEALYGSTKEMLIQFYKGEKEQLEGFIKYCIHVDILDDLREKNWKAFARMYNGKNYAVNRYDVKLAQYYNRWKHEFNYA